MAERAARPAHGGRSAGQASIELLAAVPLVIVVAVALPAAARRRLRADARRRRGRGGGDRARLRPARPSRRSRRRSRVGARPGRARAHRRAAGGPAAPAVAAGGGRAGARGQLQRLGAATGGGILSCRRCVLAGELPDAGGGLAWAAAVAVALAREGDAAPLAGGDGPWPWSRSVGDRARGPTMLAADGARELERELREAGFEAAARGRLAWVRLPRRGGLDRPSAGGARAAAGGRGRRSSACRRRLLREALDDERLGVAGVLAARRAAAAADPRGARRPRAARGGPADADRRAGAGAGREPPRAGRDRSRRRCLAPRRPPRPRAARGPPRARRRSEPVPAARRRDRPGAAAGARRPAGARRLHPDPRRLRRRGDRDFAGPAGRRPGGALGGAVDARRLRAPVRARAVVRDGTPNPAHLTKARVPRAGLGGGDRRGAAQRRRARSGCAIEFPDAASFAPLRVRAQVTAELDTSGAAAEAPGRRRGGGRGGAAERRRRPRAGAAGRLGRRLLRAARLPPGGGHAARTSPRPSTGWRPPPRRAGVALLINRGYRSDAEQAALWAAAPRSALGRAAGHLAAPLRDRARPRPAGRLRLARRQRAPLRLPAAVLLGELALRVRGGSAAVLARGRRSSAPPPSAGAADGGSSASSLPAYVPARFRDALAAAAQRWNVSAALLAAQLMAESNFNPFAVSPAGAAGIAQFMPGTAAALRPRRPVRRRGRDRRPGAPDGRPAARSSARSSSPSPPTTPARRRSPPAIASPRSPRPRPTSPGSSGSWAAPERSPRRRRWRCGWWSDRGGGGSAPAGSDFHRLMGSGVHRPQNPSIAGEGPVPELGWLPRCTFAALTAVNVRREATAVPSRTFPPMWWFRCGSRPRRSVRPRRPPPTLSSERSLIGSLFQLKEGEIEIRRWVAWVGLPERPPAVEIHVRRAHRGERAPRA